MTAKVFVVAGNANPVQIGGTWWDVGDAAGDINGGDFWSEVRRTFPGGVAIKEIRIVPDKPMTVGEPE